MEWLVNRHPSSSMWFCSCPCSWRAKKNTCLTRKCFNNHSWPGAVTKRSICYIACANIAHVLTCNPELKNVSIKADVLESSPSTRISWGILLLRIKVSCADFIFNSCAESVNWFRRQFSFLGNHQWNESYFWRYAILLQNVISNIKAILSCKLLYFHS